MIPLGNPTVLPVAITNSLEIGFVLQRFFEKWGQTSRVKIVIITYRECGSALWANSVSLNCNCLGKVNIYGFLT